MSILAFCVLLFIHVPISAQARDFSPDPDWKISVYLWTVGLSGDIGIGDITMDVDIEFSDLLSALNYGGSVVFRRDWGANVHIADLSYFSLNYLARLELNAAAVLL